LGLFLKAIYLDLVFIDQKKDSPLLRNLFILFYENMNKAKFIFDLKLVVIF
jgi:hypothetical protein